MSAKRPYILIVEDDNSIRRTLVKYLQHNGYDVEEAENGQAALHLIESKKSEEGGPSLLLLDLMMPVMDGWQFLKKRAVDSFLSKVPVVVLTGVLNVDEDPSVSAYVFKPYDLDEILKNVESHNLRI